MRAIVGYGSNIPNSFRTADSKTSLIPNDLAVVCLWSMFGLSLAAIVMAVGLAPDIGKLLALAG